jgi:hypothetical protein
VPQEILKLANAQFYPDMQDPALVNAAVELLKGNHEEFEWRVKVQADSLAQTDYSLQKQEKVEFTNAVATFLQSAATTMKAVPDTAPVIFETLKFAVSGFKGAQELEGVLDKTLDEIMKKIQNPPPPPPDPAVEKAKMEMQMEQQRFQMEQQGKQADMQMEQQRFQMDMQKQQQDLAMQREKHQMDLQFSAAQNQQRMAQDREKFDQQVAQDSAKAMMQMTKDAKEESKESEDD